MYDNLTLIEVTLEDPATGELVTVRGASDDDIDTQIAAMNGADITGTAL